MAIPVNRIALQSAHFEDFAGFCVAELFCKPAAVHTAHFQLVLVDLHDLVGIQDIVERHQNDVVTVGKANDPVEAFRRDGNGDDCIEALVDEILDRSELGGNVGTGGNDFELFDLFGNFRLFGVGLGRLDHLDPPGVSDKTVNDGDLVRAVALVPLEIPDILVPWCETGRIGSGARNLVRAGDPERRGHQQSGSQHG